MTLSQRICISLKKIQQSQIIDFLEKENTIPKIQFKKVGVISKNLEKKIEIAVENEKKITQKRDQSISTKIKPLKKIEKKEVIWL